ncbi:MAG TPA: archaellin/type IV pilin N-terminal domain-containing protein [archaeon]|nr:archaellin/type IV pilin N-terminal domain-containing protein [archaeon]
MKGISPLIAAVMLIAITVSIGVFIAGWSQQFIHSTTKSVGNKTTEAIDCSAANINIQDIYITAGTGTGSANVVVKNTGYANNLVITSAQLFNRTGGNFTGSGLPIIGFNKGSLFSISFSNVTLVSCPADFSQVIVTTNCGGISDTFDGNPKC